MNPRPTVLSLFLPTVSRRFPPTFTVVARALIAFAMLLAVSGCSTNKQTWADWMQARDRTMLHTENQGAPQTAEFPVATNTLVLAPGYNIGDGARVAPGFDLKMRNPDFPRTYISAVDVDLSSPTNGVHLKWAGPKASEGPVGPWPLTPGRGSKSVDCDCVEDSNAVNSLCTPKGSFPVAGFADHLEQTPHCRYATWILHAPRYIAIHSHTDLPPTPASAGCIRMPFETAKLIHNNSVAGVTIVNIGGTWHRPTEALARSRLSTPSARRWETPHAQ
ncbi:MAG: L,D-transpeptidase [Verrucomicrobiota bacterium]